MTNLLSVPNTFLSNSLLTGTTPSCPKSFLSNFLQPQLPPASTSFLSQLLSFTTPSCLRFLPVSTPSCPNSFLSQLLPVPTHSYPNTSTPSTLNSLQPTQHPSCPNSFLSQLLPVSIFFLSQLLAVPTPSCPNSFLSQLIPIPTPQLLPPSTPSSLQTILPVPIPFFPSSFLSLFSSFPCSNIYSILPFTSPSPFAPFRSCIRSCDVYIQQIVKYYVGRSRYQGGSHLYIRILKRNSYVRILINCERVLVYIRTANKTDW